MTDRTAALVEDVEFLVSRGVPPVEVARRVGSTVGALHARLWRAGRADLAEYLRRSERASATYARAA